MSIFVCGDLHGSIDMSKLTTSYWDTQKELTKEDYLIIAGDFGLIWSVKPEKEEDYWIKNLSSRKFTTLFVDGNHENFDRLGALPEVDMLGGKVGKVNDSIYHLKRGYVYTIEGKKFWCFGGAMSTDKEYRKEGISWWPQELPTDEEKAFGISQLEANNWCVDRVITHAAPSSVVALLGYNRRVRDPIAMWFESLKYQIQCKKWHFGHYHIDQIYEGKYMCHYNSEPFCIV